MATAIDYNIPGIANVIADGTLPQTALDHITAIFGSPDWGNGVPGGTDGGGLHLVEIVGSQPAGADPLLP